MSIAQSRSLSYAAALLSLAYVSSALAATGEELAQQTRASAVGHPAPVATLDTLDGKRVDLADLYGRKPVYLKFWATWCVPCREQMPHFEHAYEQYRSRIAVLAVNLGLNDAPEDVRKFLPTAHLTMPVAIDSAGELAESFNVVVTPLHVLIDADGNVAYVGHEANATLDQALARLAMSTPTRGAKSVVHAKASARSSVRVGDQAPAFSASTTDPAHPWVFTPGAGGKPTVIAFITSWCESYLEESRPTVSSACTQTRETLSRAYATASDSARWVTISSRVWSTPEDVAKYRTRYGVPHDVALDATGGIFRDYQINEAPTVLIVDGKGVVQQRFTGATPALATALAALDATPAKTSARTLLTEPLPRLEGKEVVMLTVELPPGAASPPHRHNGHVYVYVLEGSLVMKTQKGPEMTLHAGQQFVEKPDDIHTVSRNPSTTDRAKFLVFMIKDVGAPISMPAGS
jgi:quercetin dioxygenase-like cupin family protein/thiol-disulfide isomerase/thioredoxin